MFLGTLYRVRQRVPRLLVGPMGHWETQKTVLIGLPSIVCHHPEINNCSCVAREVCPFFFTRCK